jgi:hypothetical protein
MKEYIQINFGQTMLQDLELTPNVSDTALLHRIRTHKNLYKLDLLDGFNSRDVDMNPFVVAASKNTNLQALGLSGASGYTAESLGQFRSHPNLRELEFNVTSGYGGEIKLDLEPDIIHVFKQIIETCPKLQYVQISDSHLTSNTWGPICEALYKKQQPVTLSLWFCTSDPAATDLLRSFLHDYPQPVHFLILYHLLQYDAYDVDPMWLSHLIRPAVQKLSVSIIDITYNIEVLQNFMRSLQDRKHLRYLDFEDVDSLNLYQAILEGIPNSSYLEELRINLKKEPFHYQLSNMKTELLRSLATNLSITDVDLQLDTLNYVWWSDWRPSYDQLSNMKTELPRSLPTNLSTTDVDLQVDKLNIGTTDKQQESIWTELEYHRMGIVIAARAVYRAGKAMAVISKAGLALFDGPA